MNYHEYETKMTILDLTDSYDSELRHTSDTGFLNRIHNTMRFLECGKLVLDYQLSNGKNLQRGVIWDENLMRNYIIAILKDAVTPPIHLVLIGEFNGEFQYFVVDGKQRMTAMWRFWKNELSISVKTHPDKATQSMCFCELSKELQQKFLFNTHVTKGRLYEFIKGEIKEDDLLRLFDSLNWHVTADSAMEHLQQLKQF